MEREPDVPGGGHHRPLRKRARTTRAMESEQQERDREWEEEQESSEGASSRNRPKKKTTPKAAAGIMIEAIQGLKQLLQQDFNNKMEIIKAEFQHLEFTKLHDDRMAEEVTRTTAQMAQELSQVRKQLTQVCCKLEQTRLQLDIITMLMQHDRLARHMRMLSE
ncbi:hypothetical protein BGZ61DRAFT_372066 [Ilyonectria robusta]|uniref:uncharacterized protein n=1 Tax=Ilyonectria robusta TaxID=1079257 RepID=UPI001E8D5839|nr:uncharacterized protein BGZ61DRAFT_372066 [Ilyonectria robusta]KAH8656735.1 hypothetical protein BGZ61DRAFT_372066 [Ilyonectria robusta]